MIDDGCTFPDVTFTVPDVNFMAQVSVEPLGAMGIIEEGWSEVRNNLAEFASSETFERDMLSVFGESTNVDLGRTIIDALVKGEDWPQINVVPAALMNGAAGGFDPLTGEVYLGDSLVEPLSVVGSETREFDLVGVLTEEIAHSIEWKLNLTDTPGDEGEYLAALVNGDELSEGEIARLRGEDDRREILNGTVIVEANSDLTFETQTFPTGDQPLGMAAADFNQDGFQDIVVANIGVANGISIFLGDGKGGVLTAFLSKLEGVVPALVTVGDMNRDGNQDIVTANFRNDSVTVLFGNGKGQFSSSSNFAVGDNPLELAVADVNRDGNLDVVTPNYYSNDVSVLLGNGDGTFMSATNFTTGGSKPEGVVIKDINGDRNPDIMVSNVDSATVAVLPGNGDGTFGLPTSFPAGGKVYGITGKDLNRDGKLDLVLPTLDPDGVSVMLGIGNGFFAFPTNLPVGSLPEHVAIEDLNGDRQLDLVVINRGSDNISVLLGKGKGLFEPAINFGVGEGPNIVVVEDFNNDGKKDIAVTNSEADTISILTNTSKIAVADPNITISDTRITEGNKGRKNAKFTVTLDDASNKTVKVNYATANSSAKAGKDYRKTTGTLTFKPGQTQKKINVPIFGDTIVEKNEKFQLNLSKPKNGKIKDKRGIATIRNDDKNQPLLSIGDAQITEGDQGKKQLKFDVTLNTKVKKRVEVNYATADMTAKKGSDYQQTKGKLIFKPNQKKKTITVPILGDTLNEDDEKFRVNLSRPKNAKLRDKRGVGLIKDNDRGGDQPGDSFETAINLDILTGEQVVSDTIGFTEGIKRDTNDYFRFQTDKEGTFVLVLDDLLKNADVDLYGSEQELINQSKNKGVKPESISTILDPDTYFLRVYPQGSSRTNYRLSVDLL
ncbi:Na-Ca exchanger/integrin-beta4 [Trichodesmium erythraeum IMS101]|uniref:Na-Ca exchanger/integrin-beta4 n=1 Tax=Trichodesmium erythraeum (strain IMS101) TaxID=203124 RepID=Q118G9_TRIEI|nr:VCBS repeat-containing protein [Trichodesmium erythraeum GBRTRLIN201]